MIDGKAELTTAGGLVLKAIEYLSGNGKGWVSLESVYEFVKKGGVIDPSYAEKAHWYWRSFYPLADDLGLFEERGWIRRMDYIRSLGCQIYLTEKGRKALEDKVVPTLDRERFYGTLEKIKGHYAKHGIMEQPMESFDSLELVWRECGDDKEGSCVFCHAEEAKAKEKGADTIHFNPHSRWLANKRVMEKG